MHISDFDSKFSASVKGSLNNNLVIILPQGRPTSFTKPTFGLHTALYLPYKNQSKFLLLFI